MRERPVQGITCLFEVYVADRAIERRPRAAVEAAAGADRNPEKAPCTPCGAPPAVDIFLTVTGARLAAVAKYWRELMGEALDSLPFEFADLAPRAQPSGVRCVRLQSVCKSGLARARRRDFRTNPQVNLVRPQGLEP